MAYVHNTSHKYGKLSLRGTKYIFIRYNEHSKGYVFIVEHENGTVIELESRDVTLLEEDFPYMGEIDRDLHLYYNDESRHKIYTRTTIDA